MASGDLADYTPAVIDGIKDSVAATLDDIARSAVSVTVASASVLIRVAIATTSTAQEAVTSQVVSSLASTSGATTMLTSQMPTTLAASISVMEVRTVTATVNAAHSQQPPPAPPALPSIPTSAAIPATTTALGTATEPPDDNLVIIATATAVPVAGCLLAVGLLAWRRRARHRRAMNHSTRVPLGLDIDPVAMNSPRSHDGSARRGPDADDRFELSLSMDAHLHVSSHLSTHSNFHAHPPHPT